MKKGVELQFHWIFVMIAGVLILTFFVTLVTKQRALSEEKLHAALSSDVDSVLIGAMVSKGVAQSLPSPPQGINFGCSASCVCEVGIGNARTPFENKAIFSPKLLSKRTSIVWSLDWKLPYRVMNFLFITNPNIKYYLVYDPDNTQSLALYEQISKNLPPPIISEGNVITNIVTEKISLSDVQSVVASDEDHTRFIFLNVNPPRDLHSSFRRESASALRIQQQPQTVLEFFEKDGVSLISKSVSTYAGLPTLYAAIFSEDSNMYKCGVKTALRRLSYISDIYSERAGVLNEQMQSSGRSCNYLNVQMLLDEQASVASRLTAGQSIDQAEMARLLGIQSQVASENRQLIENSCPELF